MRACGRPASAPSGSAAEGGTGPPHPDARPLRRAASLERPLGRAGRAVSAWARFPSCRDRRRGPGSHPPSGVGFRLRAKPCLARSGSRSPVRRGRPRARSACRAPGPAPRRDRRRTGGRRPAPRAGASADPRTDDGKHVLKGSFPSNRGAPPPFPAAHRLARGPATTRRTSRGRASGTSASPPPRPRPPSSPPLPRATLPSGSDG